MFPPPPVTRLRTPTFQGSSDYWQHLPPGGWPNRPPPIGVHSDFQTYQKQYGSGDGHTVVDDNRGRPLFLPSSCGVPSVSSVHISACSSPLKMPVLQLIGSPEEVKHQSNELSNPPSNISNVSNFDTFTNTLLPVDCTVTVAKTSLASTSGIITASMNIAGIETVSTEETVQESESGTSED